MRRISLGGTGIELPAIGFGASPLGNVFGPLEPAEAERAVRTALDRGISFFDVAPYYGLTLAEERLGAALEGRRQEAVLCTKCCRYDKDDFDFSAERVARSINESLRRLRTDYLDLFIVHDIEFADVRQIVEETLPAMMRLKRSGKCRAIGISGYPLRILRETAEAAPVDFVLSYCRYNLLNREMDVELSPALQSRGIGLINASPFCMGLLTELGPPDWHPAPSEVKEAARRIVEACQRRGASVTDIALRFCLGHPYASSTLAGMASAEEVERTLSALDSAVPDGLAGEIEEIAQPVQRLRWQSGRPENN
jgi:L-galactose dehydrogenase